MSEGEKTMDNRRIANTRQLTVPSPRDASAALGKYPRQFAGNRRDFGSGRTSGDVGSYGRPVQPRNRFPDKRPRGRGSNSGDPKEEVTDGSRPVPEYGSVQAWGSKKSNLNHLLNFHFESRDVNSAYGRGRYGTSRWNSHRGGCASYNKERFLQANCQFIVREGKDYSVHSVNPDVLVDWELIEQVRIFGHEVPSCPICLYPPKAAKITRCGHIYCWPCMLHYLSLDDKTWRKCPICYESVHEKDLKSVSALMTHHYNVGEPITMKLMKKPRGSLRVFPAADSQSAKHFPCDVNDEGNTCYAKLLSADVSHIQRIMDMERSELSEQLVEEGQSSLEGSFVSAALTSLTERELHLHVDISAVDALSALNDIEKTLTAECEHALSVPPPAVASLKADHRYVCAFDDEEDLSSETASCVADVGDLETLAAAGANSMISAVSSSPALLMMSEDRDHQVDHLIEGLSLVKDDSSYTSPCAESVPDNAFYFYQAADGQHIYMHAVNIHCLVKQYGSLSHCPDTVTATIVELDSMSMDEDIRQRLRYLNHLPLTCEFVMAELDLKPPVVSSDVLTYFKDELEKRKLNRQRRARNEKKHAYRIQKAENRLMGIDPTMRIVRSDFSRGTQPTAIPSLTTQADDCVSVSSQSEAGEVVADAESSSTQDSAGSSPVALSFAQMLKGGKARPVPEVWPKTTTNDDNKRDDVSGSRSAGRDSDGDDYQPVPRYETSLSDAIQAALDSYKKQPVAGDGHEAAGGTSAGAGGTTGGKKKNKKKLLFSTSLPRSK